jgi:hypothetical protein
VAHVLLALAGLVAVGTPAAAQLLPAPRQVHHIHGLALDRRDPDTLHVATHTGLVRLRPSAEPEWIGGLDLMGFTAHPAEADLMYASGHPDMATYREQGVGNLGLLVSRDGGRTWRSVALKGAVDLHALAYSPRNGGQLYGWNVAGQPGLYRISAAGWAAETLPARGLSAVLSLAASPEPAGPLLAGTKAGLMISRDGGLAWARVPTIRADAWVTAVGHHPTDARLVYAYVARPGGGLMRSRDGGSGWERAGFVASPPGMVVALTVGPEQQVVVATSEADVLRSRDGGRTWHPVVQQGRPVVVPAR